MRRVNIRGVRLGLPSPQAVAGLYRHAAALRPIRTYDSVTIVTFEFF